MNAPGFLFSGQLAEAVGMGRDFWESDPEARELLARTSERCGRDLEKTLFEGPADEMGAASELVEREMTEAFELDPPLTVDIGVGKDWLAAK